MEIGEFTCQAEGKAHQNEENLPEVEQIFQSINIDKYRKGIHLLHVINFPYLISASLLEGALQPLLQRGIEATISTIPP